MTDQELLQAIGQVFETKMEPIRQDIHELKADVQGLKADVETLKTDIQGLKVDVETLKTDVQGLKVDVETLKTDVQELKVGYTSLDKQVSTLKDQVTNVRLYLENEQKRTLNLLLEGQQALWDRFVPHEEFDPLEDRTEVLALTVQRHSQEIRELQLRLA